MQIKLLYIVSQSLHVWKQAKWLRRKASHSPYKTDISFWASLHRAIDGVIQEYESPEFEECFDPEGIS